MALRLDDVPRHALEKGWHKPVDNPHLFVDTCVQIWPDTDYSRLHTYGVGAYCVTGWRPHASAGEALDDIANWRRIARQYDTIVVAETTQDIRAARKAGKTALVIVSQCSEFVGQNLGRLELFQKLGLRMLIPVYNLRNSLADGSWEPSNAPLSRLGGAWVDECNRVKILIDVTHVGERSSLDILERSKSPVVFSHSNPKALVDSARNITDEQMKACARTGGVIGVTNWGPLNFRKGMTARPKLEHYIDALVYTAEKVGIDHVGIGTDMSHGTYPDGDMVRDKAAGWGPSYTTMVDPSPRSKLRQVEGFDDYSHITNVIEALTKRGFAEADVKKVLGENFLRVFKAVWGA